MRVFGRCNSSRGVSDSIEVSLPRPPASVPRLSHTLALGGLLSLGLTMTGCDSKAPAASTPESAPTPTADADASQAAPQGAPQAAPEGSLLDRACRHRGELLPSAKDDLAKCAASAERMRKGSEVDDATFDRFLQCQIDAKTLDELVVGCASVLAEAQGKALGKQLDGMKAGMDAKGDAALARIRTHVEAGHITAQTLARIEKDRAHAGMGRFGDVLDDAHALIESGRLAPGTTMEVNIHRGLGADAPPMRPGDAAADVVFQDAASGRRVARISPIGGALLSIAAWNDRVGKLLRWWAQDPEGHDVELAIVPDPKTPTFDPPEAVSNVYALMELGGLVERPLLVFPDGQRKSAKQWLGR